MRGSPYVYSQFATGVNLEAAPYSLDTGQARESLNVHTSPTGAIVKRNGCLTVAEPEVTLTSLFGCQLATDVLLGAGGTKLYKITTAGVVSTLKEGLENNAAWEWIEAPKSGGQGPFWGVNGTNTPQYWDGAEATTKDWTASAGSIPNGKVIAYHENRVYIAKESTLYWSDITDPRNFESPKGGSTKIDPEDGQEITALGKVGPYLMIFKERKAFLLTDSNTGAYRRVSDDMGCIAPRTVVSTEAGTFFLTPDSQLILTDGNTFDKKLDLPIRPLLRSLNGPIAKKANGIHIGDYVYFSLSEQGTVNDTILEFNLINGSWWIHKIAYSSSKAGGVNQWAVLDPSNVATLYAAGASTETKRVFKCFIEDKFADLVSQTYQAYWISPWHVFTYPHIRKRVREIRVDGLGTYELFTSRSFSSELVKEEVKNWEIASEGTTFGGSGTFGGEGTYGDAAAITEKRFYTPGVGRAWSLKFESNDEQDLQIYSYTIGVNYRKD